MMMEHVHWILVICTGTGEATRRIGRVVLVIFELDLM